ncbi:MAG: hypothetical protein AAGJ52_11760, partial [Pseudomonadota bacterium]
MNAQTLKTIWALLRRELWESPIAFKWAPVGVSILLVFSAVVALIIGTQVDAGLASFFDGMRLLSERPAEDKSLAVSAGLFALATQYFWLMIIVILFYLSGCLFDDRKDRSILFWKSLPVSDSMTVTSKILTACLLIPAMYLLVVILTQLFFLLGATVLGFMAGINPFTTFWFPANLPKLWTVMALGLIVQALWLLPIYAWFVFCSSWAPRLPIMIAIGVPAGISLIQHSWTLATSFSLPGTNIGWIIIQRFGGGLLPSNINITFNEMDDIDFNEDLFMSFSNIGNIML